MRILLYLIRKMKKIAILTQPLKANYGGIIQNYALQTILKRNGFNVETISREYHPDASKFRVFLAHLRNETVNRILGKRKKIFSKKEADYVFSENLFFIEKHLKVSKSLYSKLDLQSYFSKNKFDIVVVGSDQTWRPKYSPDIYNYFLDFIEHDKDIIKIAYASSFGTEKWEFTEEETIRCKELVKEFDSVSVREFSGVSLCATHLNTDAQWVLDPTLLLKADDYKSLFENLNYKKTGMFNYVLDRNVDKQKFIESLSKQINMELFTNQPERSIDGGVIFDFDSIQNFKYPSLEGWLKSFYDADFVVTDSFHGTVFSILFNKPFLAIVNEERGASRFYSLLKLFDLENRLITNVRAFNENILEENIDYDKVNQILENLREKSLLFIKSNIN
ncbi:polysaccharide pyruvyl transferase family protein [Sphingobacterium sp. KB22]|uniref:Polysaccharide pyruvyl transferase family protein n=2 Tax=Sphingobacterium hungaricum TaxID=2082723 RepID=A0A928UT51_9SPHI|nr:polysaccharide pyruvyl transferase family protein [Sphingobacterium hungaricum]